MSVEGYTWLITGADHGAGVEIVKLLLASPSNTVLVPVYGTSSLEGLINSAKGQLHMIPLHCDDEEEDPLRGTIYSVSSIVAGRGNIQLTDIRHRLKQAGTFRLTWISTRWSAITGSTSSVLRVHTRLTSP
ncbi:hypothetical protein C8Q73DRAFT_711313 [Cubamyces lactineus]|nr:hypothetical protein C8Q73DRAFT_711313 [Cubamyces lactineus]